MRLRYPQGTEGWDRTRTLFLDWIYLIQVPDRATCAIGDLPQSADEGTLIAVLTADDDDDTLANGTPHCQQILAAFAAVNITPSSFPIVCGDDGLNGSARECYPDFDASTGVGVLDIFDYLAFQSLFLERGLQACDCDTSTGPGVCDMFDFICFQAAFAAGCNKE